MIIGPRYKIARRLGAGVFDKTMSPKFQSQEIVKKKGRRGSQSDYGKQMLEKQRARFMYGVNEKQFSKYVAEAIAKKSIASGTGLFNRLELRLDNIVYRAGFAPSRAGARQMVAHGHFTVDGKRTMVPSRQLFVGEKLAIRDGSKDKKLFQNLSEKVQATAIREWLKVDPSLGTVEVLALPKYDASSSFFDIEAIIEFYKR